MRRAYRAAEAAWEQAMKKVVTDGPSSELVCVRFSGLRRGIDGSSSRRLAYLREIGMMPEDVARERPGITFVTGVMTPQSGAISEVSRR